MAIQKNDVIKSSEAISILNTNVGNKIKNSIQIHSDNIPSGLYSGTYKPGYKSAYRLEKSDFQSLNNFPLFKESDIKDSSGKISALKMYEALNTILKEWSKVHKALLQNMRYVTHDGGDRTESSKSYYYNSTVVVYLKKESTSIINQIDTSKIKIDDLLRASELSTLVNSIYEKWQALPTKTYKWYSCHSSCHGSGGWR